MQDYTMSDEFRIDFVNSREYKYLATEITFRHQRPCQMCRTDDGESIDIEFLRPVPTFSQKNLMVAGLR
jgi:hypothetical protein